MPFSSVPQGSGDTRRLVSPISRFAPQNGPCSVSWGAMYLARTFAPSKFGGPPGWVVVSAYSPSSMVSLKP